MTSADRVDVFRGMAHPLRRRVIAKLAEGETSVTDLLVMLKVSQQSLSRHLAVLRETGLVSARLRSPHRFYRLRGGTLERARTWINGVGGAA